MNTLMIMLQAGADNAGLMNIGMIILLVVIFYFFMIRPQQKKQKEIRKFRENISAGDRVVTAGGIYGKIKRVKETTFVIEIANNVDITVDKGSVYPSAEEAQKDAETAEKK
ncbi:MAG: preprotein translocase subunit YajC [Muribaculaceae bacterium]|nr:preprotein translocase subunit YajC [Muribaculaceae bacterium]